MNILEARRRTLGKGVYKRTVEGNPAIAQGSLARMYPGITMQGWTEQAQYEGNQLFDISKVTNSNLVENINNDYLIIKSNTGSISGSPNSLATLCPDLKVGDEIVINAKCENANPYIYLVSSGKRIYFNTPTSLTEDDLKSSVAFYSSSTDVDGKLSEIIVNMGETALPYEPYTGRKPSPSPEYPQPITNAGKYNEEAQKWEYEITIANEQTDPDKNQTVTLTSDRPLTKWDRLEKRNGQWGWVYKSEEIESYTDGGVPGEYYSTTGQLSVGAQVWYETATKTFVPLFPEEQEQMNALYTFRPTTVLSNDCECNMSLTYKTKKSLEVTT